MLLRAVVDGKIVQLKINSSIINEAGRRLCEYNRENVRWLLRYCEYNRNILTQKRFIRLAEEYTLEYLRGNY